MTPTPFERNVGAQPSCAHATAKGSSTAQYQPCPFCGERLIAHQYRNNDREVRLSCANKHCLMRVFTPWLPSLRATIDAWNTRPLPKKTDPVGADLCVRPDVGPPLNHEPQASS